MAALLLAAGLVFACARPLPGTEIPPSPTPTATATRTPTPSPTPELPATPTLTPRPTATPTPKPTATPTPYVDRTPPKISSLEWQPTRVVNSKVYDGRVVFEAEDGSSPIAYAELNFIPKEYPPLSRAAFPEEDPRKLILKPLDGAFDELKEEFTADITDIIGGREYEVIAIVEDEAGNASTASLKTPYIREFENIAPLDDVTIIADYYTWFERPGIPGSHWYDDHGRRIHAYMPLLGEYASGDHIVISKHIDWATGHGIDAFCISWWTNGRDERWWDYHCLHNFRKFLKNSLIKDIRFCILYENNGRFKIKTPDDEPYNWIEDFDLPFNRERLKDDFLFLSKYFSHSNYLKINGKPYVRFDFVLPFRGDFEGAFEEMREELRGKGYEVYLANPMCKF